MMSTNNECSAYVIACHYVFEAIHLVMTYVDRVNQSCVVGRG